MRRMNCFGVGMLAAGVLMLSACQRIDDPQIPESSRLRVLGVPTHRPVALPAAPVVVVEQEPVVVTASENGPIVTASQTVNSPVIDATYDPANEITVRGPVLGKHYVKLADGTTAEVVELMPDENFMDVMLAPTAYSFQHGINVGITDQIMATGTVVRIGDRRMLLARELGWHKTVYTLREADGTPVWHANQVNAAGLTTSAKPVWRFW